MRLFIAIELDEGSRKRITETVDSLRRKGFRARFVEPQNIHITVKFLGEIQDSDLDKMGKDLERIIQKHSQFSIGLQGTGFFGRKSDIKIVWVGVNEGKEKLVSLMRDVQDGLNYIKKEEYEPSPHITIARVLWAKENETLAEEIEKLKDVKFGDVRVKEVVIKKSVLTPSGPIYSDYKVLKLDDS